MARFLLPAALLLLAAALPALAAGAPAASLPAAPSTAPASAPAARTKFEAGEPVDRLLTEIAARYEVIVLKAKPTEALILSDVEMPPTLEASIDLAQKILQPQGLGLIRTVSTSGDLVLKLGTARDLKDAEKQQAPVTSGTDTKKIDVTKADRPVTHLLTIQHPDMIDAFRRTATLEKGVEVSIAGTATAGYTLIFTGPALQVQRAASAIVKLDEIPAVKTAARAVTLLHLNATDAASNLNAGFSRENAGLHAVADIRTNTVVITGPEALVPQAVVNLIGMDGYTGIRPNLGNGPIPLPGEQ